MSVNVTYFSVICTKNTNLKNLTCDWREGEGGRDKHHGISPGQKEIEKRSKLLHVNNEPPQRSNDTILNIVEKLSDITTKLKVLLIRKSTIQNRRL